MGYLVGAMFGLIIGLTFSTLDDKWGGVPIPVMTMILGGAFGRLSAELDRRESVSRASGVKPLIANPPIDNRNFQSLRDGNVIVLFPDLGLPAADWKVRSWHKRPGQFVEVGEVLLEVAYNQIKSEIPAPVSGDLVSINKVEGSSVSHGMALGTIARR